MPALETYQEPVIRYGLALAGSVVAIGVGLWVLALARRQFSDMLTRKSYSDLTIRASTLALQWFGWIVIALIVLRIVGARVGVSVGFISILFLVVATLIAAGWSVVSNFAGGLMLVNNQPFRIGDDLEILEPSGAQGPLGRVTAFNYLYTTLQQIDPSHGRTVDVLVPNRLFFSRAYRREPGGDPSPLRVGK